MASNPAPGKSEEGAAGAAKLAAFAAFVGARARAALLGGAAGLRRGALWAAVHSGALGPDEVVEGLGGARGRTRLQRALIDGDDALAGMLLKKAGGATLSDSMGWHSAMEEAVVRGRLEILDLMLELGAEPDAANLNPSRAKPEPSRWSILSSLCCSGHLEQGGAPSLAIARLLVAAGADPCRADASGSTPLHAAALLHQSSSKMAKLLLACGAELDARDHAGKTPLLCAAQAVNHQAMGALIEAGADVDAASFDGETPLMAASAGRMHYSGSSMDPNVRLLLDRGADVMAKDRWGNDCAAYAGGASRDELRRQLEALMLARVEKIALAAELPQSCEGGAKALRM